MRRRIVLAILLLALAPPAAARMVTPYDHAKRDKALLDMRERLIDAIARKDTAALAEFVAADAKIGAAGVGPAALDEWLKREPGLWDEIDKTLSLGGRLSKAGEFDAPYTQFVTLKDVPAEELGIVIGRNVPVHEGPTGKARIMARYSHETAIVKRWWVAEAHAAAAKPGQPAAEPWVEIELPSKRHGFMLKRQVRWVNALRIGFAKRDGRWWVVRIETGS